MFLVRKISAKIFADTAFAVLYAVGWKRKTVEANLRHILEADEKGANVNPPQTESDKFRATIACEKTAPMKMNSDNPCINKGNLNKDYSGKNCAALEIMTAHANTARDIACEKNHIKLVPTKINPDNPCINEGKSSATVREAGSDTARENALDLYKKMLRNLTHHVGELLFCFDTYKNLPEDCTQYPHVAGGCSFELAAGAEAVIEKMRQGGIFLTAHYGNYEASGAWLCALGVPLKASFIPLKPTWLNRFVFEKVRCVKGRPYSIDAKTPRDFLRILDGGELFCLLADQDSRIPSAIDGEFLGCKVSQNPVPTFLLKHRPNTPVFFCWIEEIDERNCMRKILHAVEATDSIVRDAPSRMTNSCVVNEAYNEWLESRMQENPALWYGWTHKRFKSKNPEIYR